MADVTLNCFICELPLSDGATVKVTEKGLKSFREASLKRKDSKYEFLTGITAILVHRKCQKSYVNAKLIASYLKKKPVPEYPAIPRSRSGTPSFSFKKHCFLCSKSIPDNYLVQQRRLPAERRDPVFNVRQLNIRSKVIDLAKNRKDDWGDEILHRLTPLEGDLVAEEARYHLSCMRKLSRPKTKSEESAMRGAFGNEVQDAMKDVFSFLEENEHECQFSMKELVYQIKGDYKPHIKTMKAQLLAKYGSGIIISEASNKPAVVSFRSSGEKILTDVFYKDKCEDEQKERMRIVQAAAGIVLEDIRSKVYNKQEYPPSDDFFRDVESDVPETLRNFLEHVILTHKKGGMDKWQTKCTSLAHCIISAARPRSFLSSVQIGVSTFIYKKFGSRRLIDSLESLGFCASYSEANTFELSSIMRDPLKISRNSFSQFVYDNADFNTQTLDGCQTFHAMGGIQCITPTTSIYPDQRIARLIKKPSASEVGKFGAVPLRSFEKRNDKGLSNIKIVNIDKLKNISKQVLPSSSDLMWLLGKNADIPGVPGWNGFMEEMTNHLPYEKTFVKCLPFINYPASNYDTVYTSLISAAEECRKLKQKTCFVTYDQPLYMKAQDILANNADNTLLNNVIVRLGGFHLLMSFLGTIGFIMTGSGLKELFNTVYALNSIEKMMAGHAYSRALRAHFLAYLSLADIIMPSIELSPVVKTQLENLMWNLDRTTILKVDEEEVFQEFAEKFEKCLLILEHRGPTAKLWVQYFRLIALVRQFIEAERTGNWELHLDTIQRMLPYFFAGGHFLYTKSCQLYLQQMRDLKDKIPEDEYEIFTTKGKFTNRRSDKFFCGTWSDMVIEQSLMKTMKSVGGLTRGRGVSQSILTTWTLGTVYLQNVCDSVEQFVKVGYESSEQHVQLRSSRINRDNQDVQKMLAWFNQHPPFPVFEKLKSLSTGIVGDEKINCHMAQEIGSAGLAKSVGSNFQFVTFKRNDRCTPLGTMKSGIKIEDEVVPVDPHLIFRRICIAKQSEEELVGFLEYELSPFPLALFNEEGMRKGVKSSLYKSFKQIDDEIQLKDSFYIIDGGFLLHRVVWQRNTTFSCICEAYVQFVRLKYSTNSIVIFDGYPDSIENLNTKSAERVRRERKQSSVDIIFDETMKATIGQEAFLANSRNKNRLISMIKRKFEMENLTVQQAVEDADTLIIKTAIEIAPVHQSVIIVGEDIDLLILLTALSQTSNVYFMKPGKGKVSQQIYSSYGFQEKTTGENLLFLHAFSGCDSTSAIFGHGKIKFVKILVQNPDLLPLVQLFQIPNADPQAIAKAGNQFLLRLYGCKDVKMTLNDFRHQCFIKTSYNSKHNIASLPPTEAAAEQHSFRTYHQVQLWRGNVIEPEKWGWKRTSYGLSPITTLKPPAPPKLLKLISCRCKKGCRGACGCRKSGLKCSIMCLECNNSCENIPEDFIDDLDEDDPQEVELEMLTEKIGECDESILGESCESEVLPCAEAINIEFSDLDTQRASFDGPDIHKSDIAEPGPSARVKRSRIT